MIFRGAFIASLFVAQLAKSVPPELDPQKDLPRFPAVEATNVLKTFQLKPGFRLELAAAEPNVYDPIALSFDENGRMFVVEMSDYSERRDEMLGRIRFFSILLSCIIPLLAVYLRPYLMHHSLIEYKP